MRRYEPTKQKGSLGENAKNMLDPKVKSSGEIKEDTFIITPIPWTLI
jgi:hypothetical protein